MNSRTQASTSQFPGRPQRVPGDISCSPCLRQEISATFTSPAHTAGVTRVVGTQSHSCVTHTYMAQSHVRTHTQHRDTHTHSTETHRAQRHSTETCTHTAQRHTAQRHTHTTCTTQTHSTHTTHTTEMYTHHTCHPPHMPHTLHTETRTHTHMVLPQQYPVSDHALTPASHL